MNKDYFYYTIYFSKFLKTYKSVGVMLLVMLGVFILDWIFYEFIVYDFAYFGRIAQYKWFGDNDIISFAPEAWLGLLGLVLGTLIIVISVASQSTPKLIDLYAGDNTSLLYIWYIVVGSVHNMYIQLLSKANLDYIKGSILLNTYIMLPLALLMAVPYVLYILRYTKTSNVITKIYVDNIKRIFRLQARAKNGLLDDGKIIADYQYELFESLNQLDDLLEYVTFKEPKGDIMNKISLTIQQYIAIKSDLDIYKSKREELRTSNKNMQERISREENEDNDIELQAKLEELKKELEKYEVSPFFLISHRIANDVSFKTMTGQFRDMERNRTLFEQKGFRLLGNAYIRLIEQEEFDLASLCAYELSECGRVAIEYKDWSLVEVVLVRFNTLLRFGIKHGLKNKEPRNLYNAIFHYSGFIHHIIKSMQEPFIKLSCEYLNKYVNEIYMHSRNEKPFGFLVDAFTWEFKRILMELNRNNLEVKLQKEVLGWFLKIDNLSDNYEEASLKGRKFTSGTRGFQIALALYYLEISEQNKNNVLLEEKPSGRINKTTEEILVDTIIRDMLDDHEYMDKESLKNSVIEVCNRLKGQFEKFWEDTDRGNLNLYFSKDIKHIPAFMELFEKGLDESQGKRGISKPPVPPSLN